MQELRTSGASLALSKCSDRGRWFPRFT